MNYSDLHINRVRYNINTTNKAKYKNVLFRYLTCIINYKNNTYFTFFLVYGLHQCVSNRPSEIKKINY